MRQQTHTQALAFTYTRQTISALKLIEARPQRPPVISKRLLNTFMALLLPSVALRNNHSPSVHRSLSHCAGM